MISPFFMKCLSIQIEKFLQTTLTIGIRNALSMLWLNLPIKMPSPMFPKNYPSIKILKKKSPECGRWRQK